MPSQWLKNLGHKASHVKLLRPLYDAQLGKRDTHLNFQSYPADSIGGDAGHGRWIASGQIDSRGKRIAFDKDNWLIGGAFQNTPFFTKMHQFDFLPELTALGGDLGRKTARQITWDWLNDFEQYHYLTWEPSLTAHRLVNWLTAYPFAFEQADDVFLDVFHNQFYRQFQHLIKTLDNDETIDLMERFDVLWALVTIGAHCSDLSSDRLESWIILLKGAVEDISFDDGGVTTYSPKGLLTVVQHLSTTKQSLSQVGQKPPLWLVKRIETGLRFLNHLTHGDKNLTCLGGSVEEGKTDIEKLNRLAGLRVRRGDFKATESGYSVMRKGKTSVIISHGEGHDTSPNAFEMGHGAHRLIVGCGQNFYDETWQNYLHIIQAFSTLSIEESQPHSCDLKTHLESLNGACLWSGTHEGYKEDYHLTHTRRLYLDADGCDFRGEDILVRSIATKPIAATIRFHLHPSVKTSMVNDGASILMQLPNGGGWMFEASNAYISTEESIYFGTDGMTPRKTSQIVLSADMEGVNHPIKWAIRKI